eukprot:6863213-Prymnesium_polylepis.1
MPWRWRRWRGRGVHAKPLGLRRPVHACAVRVARVLMGVGGSPPAPTEGTVDTVHNGIVDNPGKVAAVVRHAFVEVDKPRLELADVRHRIAMRDARIGKRKRVVGTQRDWLGGAVLCARAVEQPEVEVQHADVRVPQKADGEHLRVPPRVARWQPAGELSPLGHR